MAISDTDVLAIYTANGSNTNFTIPFDHIVGEISSVIRVAVRDPSTLVVTNKTLGVDFTLSPAESVITNTKSTTVVFGTAPANGHKVMVFRVQPKTQLTQYQNNGPFLAKDHEKALDRATLVGQEVDEIARRALRVSPWDTAQFTKGYTLDGAPSGGEILSVNEDGDGFTYGPTVTEVEDWKTDAVNAANAAASSANSASSSASAASGSASAASSSESAAEAARDLALQYRNEAEGFKDGAEAAALSAVTTIGPVGATPNANGGTIASNTLTLQPASTSHPGVMTAGTQTFAGSKAWTGRMLFNDLFDLGASADSITATGDDQTIPAAQMENIVLRSINASLTSIAGFETTDWYRFHVFMNVSAADQVIRNQSSATSAANRVITGTGSDLTVPPGGSVILVYDVSSTRWRVAGGAGGGSTTVFGSTGTPRSIVAATGIVAASGHMSASVTDQVVFLKGDTGGEEDISANPQIQAHTIVGAKMRLYGVSDADFVKLETGNGLLLNGDWYSYAGSILDLMWNGSVWAEAGRNR